MSDPRKITIIYPYYENPKFLAYQLGHLRRMDETFPGCLSVIIVDDGSPTMPALRVVKAIAHVPARLRLFRIDIDVRWNWLAARNIGAHYAPEGWLLLTDMDHVIPRDTLRALVYNEYSSSVVYRFSRREHTGLPIHPHPNSWFMTRKMYWRVGGYDEALSGHYGTDGLYRRRVAATAPVLILPQELERHEYQDDSSTTRYLRKQPEDAEGKRIARTRHGMAPKVLSFPYHEEAL